MKVSKPFIAILIVSMGFAAYLFFFSGPRRPHITKPSSAPKTEMAGHETILPPQVPANVAKRLERIDRDASWLRDPFELPKMVGAGANVKPDTMPRLVAIIEGKQGRYAIFGSKIVARGDYIGEERVLEIGHDKVVLDVMGEKRVIPIQTDRAKEVLRPYKGGEKR